MNNLIWALALWLCSTSMVWAKPVSYAGGWSAMQMNDADTHSVGVSYSPTSEYSVGYLGEYRRDTDWMFQGAQLNLLLKRINMPKSQANFYIKSGIGAALADPFGRAESSTAAAFGGLLADWEDRRFFVSYENMGMAAGHIDRFFEQKARVGIAPYEGDYGDVHTWLMLETKHEVASDKITVTPLLRFFYRDVLAEIGMNNEEKLFTHLMINF